jgi:serine/threonine-protein kinase
MVLDMGKQLAGGLDYAHRQGVTHLNLQPEVILLDGSRPIIRDFGISRLVGEITSDDQTSLGMTGINAYTAPELVTGQKGGFQSDIYSFGLVLYYLLTGKPPYEESSPYDLIEAHQKRVPAPIREVNPEVPQPVQDAIGKMIAKEPRDRPRDFKEVINQLETCHTAFEVIEVRRAYDERARKRAVFGKLIQNSAACWALFPAIAVILLGVVYLILRD